MSKVNYIDVYGELVSRAFIIEDMSENSVKGLKAKQDAYKQLEKDIAKVVEINKGKLIPIKTMTLGFEGKHYKLVKGLPVPKELEDKLNSVKNKKQYFK